jgi:hypothetical protein
MFYSFSARPPASQILLDKEMKCYAEDDGVEFLYLEHLFG